MNILNDECALGKCIWPRLAASLASFKQENIYVSQKKKKEEISTSTTRVHVFYANRFCASRKCRAHTPSDLRSNRAVRVFNYHLLNVRAPSKRTRFVLRVRCDLFIIIIIIVGRLTQWYNDCYDNMT